MLVVGEIILWSLIAVLLLLALVLVAAACGAHALRKSIELASITPCPKCGKPVGREAVIAGQQRYAQKVEEMRRQNPGVRLRLLAEWEIHCPNCAGVFYFYPASNNIATESMLRKSCDPVMNILYLENHATFAQQVIGQFLQTHRVTVVPSLAAARSALASGGFDLVLSDYDLDDGKGEQFVRECRTAHPALPIIAVSSHAAGNAALVAAGASAVCSKMEFDCIQEVIQRFEHQSHPDSGSTRPSASPTEKIIRICQASGMGVPQSRRFVLEASPELVDRIIRAHETQSERVLHDPIEDEAEFKDAISQADHEVDALLRDEPRRLGLCHLHWKHKKRILKERLGITWYSPAEMNPGSVFD